MNSFAIAQVFDCGGELISAVDFASFGRPRGTCEDGPLEIVEECHFLQSVTALEDRCLGQATCLFTVSATTFGGEPHCSRAAGAKRWLAATLACGEAPSAGGVATGTGGLGIGWQFNIFVVAMYLRADSSNDHHRTLAAPRLSKMHRACACVHACPACARLLLPVHSFVLYCAAGVAYNVQRMAHTRPR